MPLRGRAGEGRPVAWIDLDATHNDAQIFLGDLSAALCSVTDFDIDALVPRGATADEYSTVVAARLGRAISVCSVPFALVIDDVQRLVELSTLDLLGAVAASMPAASELVLVGRACPVPELRRLRALPGLVEIGANDLALDSDDAANLLRDMGVDLSPVDAQAVVDETEGWPVGVRLAGVAALEAHRQDEVDRAGPWLSGRELAVSEFLGSEWLLDLTDDEREFLTWVSPLERLTAPVCDAVRGRHDSGEVLHRLFRDRMLLIPLDRRQDTYRMHGLLREALGAELERTDPDAVRSTHVRASTYYESSGDIDRAIRHAVAGGDLDRAERLVVEHTPSRYTNGHYTTIEQWIGLLPRARVLGSTGLCLCAAVSGSDSVVPSRCRCGCASASTPQPLRPAKTRWRGCACSTFGPPRTPAPVRPALENAKEAYRGLPPGIWHTGACLAYGVWSWTAGDDGAAAILREGAEESAVLGAPSMEACCTAMLSMIAHADRDVALARTLALRARQIAVDHGLEHAPGMAIVSAAHALAMAGTGDAEAVAQGLRAARTQLAQLKDLSGWANVQTRVALAHTSLLLGDAVGAETMLREVREFLVSQPDAVRAHRQVAELEDLSRHLRRHSSTGSSSLTTAELRVLRYLPTNLSLAEIGTRLYVSALHREDPVRLDLPQARCRIPLRGRRDRTPGRTARSSRARSVREGPDGGVTGRRTRRAARMPAVEIGAGPPASRCWPARAASRSTGARRARPTSGRHGPWPGPLRRTPRQGWS